MHSHHLEFKINCLYKEKMILVLESIAVFILALFVSVFLPQLLFQFVFQGGVGLMEEPPVFKYIPAVSFAVAILYFLYAAMMVVMKKMRIKQLEKELSMLMTDDSCNCGCEDCNHGDHAHHWMSEESSDSTQEMARALSKKKSPSKKKTGKRA